MLHNLLKLYRMRIQPKMTQEDVADAIGLKRPSYANMEDERRKPKGKYFEKLVKILQLNDREAHELRYFMMFISLDEELRPEFESILGRLQAIESDADYAEARLDDIESRTKRGERSADIPIRRAGQGTGGQRIRPAR